jgi:hypothetical protein
MINQDYNAILTKGINLNANVKNGEEIHCSFVCTCLKKHNIVKKDYFKLLGLMKCDCTQSFEIYEDSNYNLKIKSIK